MEKVADNLSKAGWSWGCVSAIDSEGRKIWIADARRDDGAFRCGVRVKSWRLLKSWKRRFVVAAD
jgi:hypothetical protein